MNRPGSPSNSGSSGYHSPYSDMSGLSTPPYVPQLATHPTDRPSEFQFAPTKALNVNTLASKLQVLNNEQQMANKTSLTREDLLKVVTTEPPAVFDRIKEFQKQYGNMFLFGRPTPDLVNLMVRVYHENVIRNMTLKNGIQCMFGFIQLEDGNIYCTISEDPKEDSAFNKKYPLMISLLQHSNIKVEFPENDDPAVDDDIKQEFIGYQQAVGNYQYKALNASQVRIAKDLLFIPDDAQSYDPRITEKPYTVHFVNSLLYLSRRRQGKQSFVPFKKVKAENTNHGKEYKIECNNGSTCVEAKLFSYVKDTLNVGLDKIKGYAIFWIGKELPPKHYLAAYSYRSVGDNPANNANAKKLADIRSENQKLEEMTQACIDASKGTLQMYQESYPETFFPIMKRIAQPLAIACPGCFVNFMSYKKGAYSNWNSSKCGHPLHGGRKTRRNRRTKRHTRKRH